MTPADILGVLLRVNLAAGAAILGVIALRKIVRKGFGARVAYGLWLLPVLASAAVLAPARQVVIERPIAPVFATVSLAFPTEAKGLDPFLLLVALWLAGAVAAVLFMAHLQHRFTAEARKGAIGPAVVGVIAPRIVTPKDFEQRYSREEQALVLAHERAHIVRHDSRLNGLSAMAQCLCWFNPVIHLAARLMRIDQELACDEAVVTRLPDARRAYAEVLLKAQLAIRPLPLGCYWPSGTRHPLVERIAMLKLKAFSPIRRSTGAAALAVLCAGAGITAWAAQPAHVRAAVTPVQEKPDYWITHPPVWLIKPIGDNYARDYPLAARKRGLNGRTPLTCVVTSGGALTDCTVKEDPIGYGFGDAALRISKLWKMKPQTADGRPVGGHRFSTMIVWKLHK